MDLMGRQATTLFWGHLVFLGIHLATTLFARRSQENKMETRRLAILLPDVAEDLLAFGCHDVTGRSTVTSGRRMVYALKGRVFQHSFLENNSDSMNLDGVVLESYVEQLSLPCHTILPVILLPWIT